MRIQIYVYHVRIERNKNKEIKEGLMSKRIKTIIGLFDIHSKDGYGDTLRLARFLWRLGYRKTKEGE